MERTVRYSKKREAILAAIQGTSCHPSAEWVYQQLRPLHPDLSLGTVYRNLTFFRERGLVQSVGVVQGQERFDAITTPTATLFATAAVRSWTFRISVRRAAWNGLSARNTGSRWNAASSLSTVCAPTVQTNKI